jgi:hypothetical protein
MSSFALLSSWNKVTPRSVAEVVPLAFVQFASDRRFLGIDQGEHQERRFHTIAAHLFFAADSRMYVFGLD